MAKLERVGYIAIADNMFDHQKFVDISDNAALLHVHATMWSHNQNTDGVIPPGAVRLLARRWGWPDSERLAESLVIAGVWELDPDEGYRIHDYTDWQQTKEDRLSLSEARREAGRRGGLASVKARQERAGQPKQRNQT